MNLRALLIATLAAFFGLGTPLCAFFCLSENADEPAAVASHTEGSAPCHGSAPEAPGEAPARDSECDCGSERMILTKSESAQVQIAVDIAASFPTPGSAFHPRPERSLARMWLGTQHLPPPDLLLLKSTLLL
jgi:hypothetical protein